MKNREKKPAPDPELTKMGHAMMPFTKTLGMELISASPERVLARAQWAAERCTASGVLHGGYLMALADSVGAASAVVNLPQGAMTATLESKTNFFRPVTEGDITITATPVHIGRSTIVVQTDITDDDGHLVSRTLQTQTVKAG